MSIVIFSYNRLQMKEKKCPKASYCKTLGHFYGWKLGNKNMAREAVKAAFIPSA